MSTKGYVRAFGIAAVLLIPAAIQFARGHTIPGLVILGASAVALAIGIALLLRSRSGPPA